MLETLRNLAAHAHNNILKTKMREHTPVLLQELVERLDPRRGSIIVDATFGFGGHAREVSKKIGKRGKLIGFERDEDIVLRVKHDVLENNITLINDNFTNLKKNLDRLGIDKVDGVYFDLGISTFHYHGSGRGFSFSKDEPLDMRLDKDSAVSARDLINGLSKDELANLFYNLSQEYRSRQIAAEIVKYRRRRKIETSKELADIISRTTPRHGRIHPATKVFQALRIAVNNEIDNLSEGLNQAVKVLNKDGKLLVITFHSGEDRVVKNFLKDAARAGEVEILTKKPLQPTRQECINNPPSRSAKLRVARRV